MSKLIVQEDFILIMKNLPVTVEDEDMEEMFEYADKDKDGKLSFQEFQVMLLKRRYITDKYVGLAGASYSTRLL